ncbi:MAG: 50S ribosomal protein L32 [Firmicutes bacterium ADurb.Bin300]|mgnify:CR=1 FL=1|nr:MAG: 50S ribosomal protein L32 [Firmicutes bacterium ADurb.Bin300]
MAIAPKRRVSKTRRDKRRSSVWKLDAPQLEKCSKCGSLKKSHRLCMSCGYYNGRQVLQIEE